MRIFCFHEDVLVGFCERHVIFLYLSEGMSFYAVRDSISSMVAEGEM